MFRSLLTCLMLVLILILPPSLYAGRVLNNFVTELLNRNNVKSGEMIKFVNPRAGWVFFSLTGGGKAELYSGYKVIISSGKTEAMRYLPKGTHAVCVKGGTSHKLIVRSIPEIMYNAYRHVMCVPELNKPSWDWSFLKKYVLPNVNVIVVSRVSQKPEDKHIKEWLSQGKRWVYEGDIPFHAKTVDEAYEWLVKQPGFSEPFYAAYLADEFCATKNSLPKLKLIMSVLDKIYQNPKFAGKLFYPYVTSPTQPFDDYKYLCKFVVEHKELLAREWYCIEQPAKKNMFDCFAPAWHTKNRELWREKYPGAENSRIIVFSAQDLPYSNKDTNPGLDYKVWLDWQFKFVATYPAFRGVRGAMCYKSARQSEEIVRWTGKLYRHYCIEGKTTLLSTDPYVLTYLKNPDFDEGLKDWTLNPAGEGSIYAEKMEKYGNFQGRWAVNDGTGDHFLVTKRSAIKPNTFSQTIKNLTPGRFYTFRMYTGDYSGIKKGSTPRVKHPVSIGIEGAKISKRVQHVYYSRDSKLIKPFSRKNVCWFNFHWVLFKATSPEAKLIISDWVNKKNPGGAAGQETAFNFMQVQPYFSQKGSGNIIFRSAN